MSESKELALRLFDELSQDQKWPLICVKSCYKAHMDTDEWGLGSYPIKIKLEIINKLEMVLECICLCNMYVEGANKTQLFALDVNVIFSDRRGGYDIDGQKWYVSNTPYYYGGHKEELLVQYVGDATESQFSNVAEQLHTTFKKLRVQLENAPDRKLPS